MKKLHKREKMVRFTSRLSEGCSSLASSVRTHVSASLPRKDNVSKRRLSSSARTELNAFQDCTPSDSPTMPKENKVAADASWYVNAKKKRRRIRRRKPKGVQKGRIMQMVFFDSPPSISSYA